MKFELWSVWHYLYILSPFLLIALLYLPVRKKSQKVKDRVSLVLGIINLLILLVRNVDIYLRSGWNLEVIPLQVCHIGNIIVGLALLTKKNWLIVTGFCFNLIPALAAMIFADSLANYSNLLAIRPQSYIWGHIAIVVGAVYALLVYKPSFQKKDILISVTTLCTCLITAILCNSLFREWFGWKPNYFYIFNAKGTPFDFIYDLASPIKVGWFEINFLYTAFMLLAFTVEYIFMGMLAKKLLKLPKKSR